MSTKKAVAGGVAVLSALLTAGVLLAPAAGATPGKYIETGSSSHSGNSAYAVKADGLIKVTANPFVDDAKGFNQQSVNELSLPGGLAQLKVLNAHAGAGQAGASVADVNLNLSGLVKSGGKPVLAASAINANCKSGKVGSSLAKAYLAGTKLDVAPAPNTTISVPGLASVTLNKQVKNKNGTVTVTAISISIDGLQTLDLSSCTCHPGDGDDDGDGGSTPTSKSSAPTSSSTKKPVSSSATPAATTSSSDGGAAPAGDAPDPSGNAPVPTPVKAHLDVTG